MDCTINPPTTEQAQMETSEKTMMVVPTLTDVIAALYCQRGWHIAWGALWEVIGIYHRDTGDVR